ncbi:MAG: BTAD domain-containing putative transcriptional regulator [Lachnospiraceae bacterium]|nr:BTAD domain-containing putative transcriptional regulator [Lachnospiraceae bacterium]
MEEKIPVLKVQMLGGFSMTLGEKPLSFSRNSTTKAMKLLQILLYHCEKGISREKLIEYLYGREDMADAANSLRVTVHRMKKMVVDMGLPEYNYVKISKGIYRWDAPMETIVDAHVFEHILEKAKTEENKAQKIKDLEEACNMYAGEFIPGLSEEEWILIEGVQYKKKYTEALQQLCSYLWEDEEYEVILKLCENACELYPFDEWQAIRIDCFMAMNRYKEAISEYEETARLFFEELGISPSEKMIQQFKFMSEHMNYKPQTIKEIKGRLMEDEDETGAYYCTLPSFRDSYRLVRRIIERNGQSVYMMLCSLIDSKGRPMEQGDKLNAMTDELHHSIKHCLRRGDSFTKFSPSQFLILLIGTNKENCDLIFDRIASYFSRDHRSWKKNLEFYITSIADLENDNSKILFRDNDIQWQNN